MTADVPVEAIPVYKKGQIIALYLSLAFLIKL